MLLMLGAIGVVFGDIGTSPIYAMSSVLAIVDKSGVPPGPQLIYGLTSTIIWTMVLIVSLLYVRLLLHADNDGEGGLLALLGLLRRTGSSVRSAVVLTAIATVGAAMFLGDSVITPAISVLSATEGLELTSPGLKAAVVPLAVGVLVVLFLAQRYGTARIGRSFGPVMIVWFAVLTVLGLVAVAREPSVLQALSPHWVVRYFVSEPLAAFLSLGGVVLAVTGAEALYADLGHLGRRPIAQAWTFVVLPALVVNYLGQAAIVVHDPSVSGAPFFSLVPSWARLAVVVLATLATIIASQAVISGAFTVVQQASRLGLLPTLRISHTSDEHVGQIYVPVANWLLGVAVLTLVLTFRSSASLASAYGLAVTVTITVTTTMYLVLRGRQDRRPGWRYRVQPGRIAAALVLGVVLVLLAANVPKIVTGGWLPVGLAGVLIVVMTTWAAGRHRVDASRRAQETPLLDLLGQVNAPHSLVSRVPGGAVFFARNPDAAPIALSTMIELNHSLQRTVLLLTLETEDRPRVPDDDRFVVDSLGDEHDGICHVQATYGFSEHPDLASLVLAAVDLAGGELDGLDPATAMFFVSHPVVVFDPGSSMMRWRQRLFLGLDRMTPDAVDLFDLPSGRTVVIGRQITL